MFNKDKLIETLDVFNTDSRYLRDNIYYDKALGRYFTNLPIAKEIPNNENDSFFKVTLKTENRLDLIANSFYNNSRLWWVIAEANNIDDPTTVSLGTTLVIPSISSIFGVGGVLG
jgi:nucleoid-associated protein YgaU